MDTIESLRPWRRRPLPRNTARIELGLVAGSAAVFAATTARARRRHVNRNEEAVFRQLNELPGNTHRPVWAVMQSGSLASVAVAASAALVARRPVTAAGLGVSGLAVWGGAKVVKRRVQRGRPAVHLEEVNIRGREQTGHGFPSGHAAVATTLAIVAAPVLPPTWRTAAWITAALTAMSRM